MKELRNQLEILLNQSGRDKKENTIFSFSTEGRILAYLHSEATTNSFKYHYQQLKPSCCDVFIWIGVCS